MRIRLFGFSLAVCVLALGLAACQSGHVPDVEVSAEYQESYELLKHAEYFANGGIGFSGDTPDELAAFSELYGSPHAKEHFQKLEAEATMAGKLYALCGLYYLDYENYQQYLAPYKTSKENVKYFAGCSLVTHPVSDLIYTEQEPVMRLESPDDTIEAWPDRTGASGWRYDFYGGGYPASILNHIKNFL